MYHPWTSLTDSPVIISIVRLSLPCYFGSRDYVPPYRLIWETGSLLFTFAKGNRSCNLFANDLGMCNGL